MLLLVAGVDGVRVGTFPSAVLADDTPEGFNFCSGPGSGADPPSQNEQE